MPLLYPRFRPCHCLLFPLFGSLLFISFMPGTGRAQARQYPRAQLQADLVYLHDALQKEHPGLYLYSSKARIDAFFDSLSQQLPEQLDDWAFYDGVASFSRLLGDGHTLFFPNAATLAYHNEHSLFFPFKIYWDGQRMYVHFNYHETDLIPNGSEILFINGHPPARIVQHCTDRMMRDGHSDSYPVWILNQWFNEYYSYFYGHPERFDIMYRKPDGSDGQTTVPALSKETIFANRQKRYPGRAFSRSYDVSPGQGIRLQTDTAQGMAVLSIRDFERDILKKNYRQHFKRSIRRCFRALRHSGAQTLVLDLRDNQGGEIKYGIYLLSWLMREPFRVLEGYASVAQADAETDAMRMRAGRGPGLGLHRPRARAFRGEVYLLINGGSFSNSGIVASALQHYRRATIVGEESGGNPFLLSGDPRDMVLPHSGLQVSLSTKRYVIREPARNTGHGIVPDHPAKPNIKGLLRGVDEGMEVVKATMTRH